MRIEYLVAFFVTIWTVVAESSKVTENVSAEGDPKIGRVVILEVEQNKEIIGNLTLGIFYDDVPKTAKNFYLLAKTQKYTGTLFHRVIKDFMIQGGDIDGSGGYSIYGKERGSMPDENFKIKHDRPGRLAMANAGPDSALSQFYITMKATSWLDGHYVVFGQLIDGFDTLKSIDITETDRNNKPKNDVNIHSVYTYLSDGTLDNTLTDEERTFDITVDVPTEEDPNSLLNLETGKKDEPGSEDNGKQKQNDREAQYKEHEAQRAATRPKYEAFYVLVPLVIFGALITFMLVRSRRNIMYAIRGPRYRRVQVHR